ncbi:hypothetical protein AB4Z54_09330 [Streptomyces sp. MCAF7]
MDPQSDAGPVFVDLSGRRARLLRHAGVVAGAAVIGYTALLGTGFSGGTAVAPDTLAPGSVADRHADRRTEAGAR